MPFPVPVPEVVAGSAFRRYSGASFALYRNGRIASFVIYRRGTSTSHGVRVGDPLAKARRRYAAACKKEIETHADVIPAQCWRRLGPGRNIAFSASEGSDEIGSIALSAEPFPYGCERGGYAPRRTVRRCIREAMTGRRVQR